MHTFPVVEHLHVFKDVFPHFVYCSTFPQIQALLFHSREKTLQTRVVERAARPAHALPDPVLFRVTRQAFLLFYPYAQYTPAVTFLPHSRSGFRQGEGQGQS